MNKTKLSISLFCLIFVCLFATSVSAHTPRMESNKAPIVIENPEISQAFYEVLAVKPQIYTIDSDKSFTLYVNLLVPKSSNPYERYEATIYQIDGSEKKFLAYLDPKKKIWDEFYEEFAGDTYYQGPEFEQNVPAGKYEIDVYSKDNLGKYVLAVGKIEKFGLDSLPMMLMTLPRLKIDFFEVSPITLLTARLGIILVAEIAVLILLSFLFWKLVRLALKKYIKNHKFEKNINKTHRLLRLILAIFVLVAAIYYWNIILGIISSFLFYEATSSWCIIPSFLNRNELPKKKTSSFKKKVVKKK